MFETLKKIGVPAAIATAIALLTMVIPFLFKIDERYAKQVTLETEISRLEKQNTDLVRELALAAGFQQAMIAILKQQSAQVVAVSPSPSPPVRRRPTAVPMVIPPITSVVPEVMPLIEQTPPPPAEEQPKNWKALSDGLLRQQQRLAK